MGYYLSGGEGPVAPNFKLAGLSKAPFVSKYVEFFYKVLRAKRLVYVTFCRILTGRWMSATEFTQKTRDAFETSQEVFVAVI